MIRKKAKLLILALAIAPPILYAKSQSIMGTLEANVLSGDRRYVYADGKVSLEYQGTHYTTEHLKYDRISKIIYIDGRLKAVSKKENATLVANKLKADEKYIYATNDIEVTINGVNYKADNARFDQVNRVLYVDGHVVVFDKKTKSKLVAEAAIIDEENIYADGKVILDYQGIKYRADHVVYERATKNLFVNGNVAAVDSKSKATFKASKVKIDEQYVYADGSVRVSHEEIKYNADHAKFNRQEKILDVWSNVKIVDKKNGTISSTRARINVDEKGIEFDDFTFDGEKNQWVSTANATKEGDCYTFKDANYSSCDKENPDWHIEFKQAKYNATRKYVKLKHVVFYAKKIPIFYFPYFAFPIVDERTTGLLMPGFGHTSKGGYLYNQPFFWAINDGLDIQFDTQIRHLRGTGMYATMRFADSPYSHGSIRVGYFQDFDKYTKKYNVDKNNYYGYEIRYESDNVLRKWLPKGFSDFLYVNLQDYNDIDYINLQKDELMHHEYSKYRESRINYALYNNDYYFGVGARYFKLSSDADNDSTIQMLPAVTLHKYQKEIFWKNLTYSFEANIFNHVRKEGSEALVADLSLPLEYRDSFFNDYLKIKLTEELHAYQADFTDVEAADSIHNLSLTSKLKLYSDISKTYGDSMHSMQFFLQYSHQNNNSDYAQEYENLDDYTKDNFITYKPFDNKVNIGFAQYYFGADKTLKLKQRVSQSYYPNEEYKRGELMHELSLKYKQWTLYNASEYSWEYNSFAKSRSYIKYSNEKLSLLLGDDWAKNVETDEVTRNQLDVGFSYKYNDRLKLFASTKYDMISDQRHSIENKIGFSYDKGCWNTTFTYAREAEELDGRFEYDNKFEVKINLLPLGGFTLE